MRYPALLTSSFAFALGATPPVTPHDGPKHKIRVLTKRIQKSGQTAELLFQRSVCYIALRRHWHAIADLDAALRLDPNHEMALIERVRVSVDLGQTRFALEAAERAKPRLRTRALQFLLARVTAEVLTDLQRYEDALRQIEIALRAVPDQVSAILRRSILRHLLGQNAERLAELERCMAQPFVSPIVEEEYVDALIESGATEQALAIIEPRLTECRFQSGWLIRRARARLATGATRKAEVDLMAALRELTQRIRPARPDLLLVADRAIVLHLLGQSEAARSDLALLRKNGYPALLYLRTVSDTVPFLFSSRGKNRKKDPGKN